MNDAITSVPIAATEGAEEAICFAEEEGDALGIYHRHQSAVAVNRAFAFDQNRNGRS